MGDEEEGAVLAIKEPPPPPPTPGDLISRIALNVGRPSDPPRWDPPPPMAAASPILRRRRQDGQPPLPAGAALPEEGHLTESNYGQAGRAVNRDGPASGPARVIMAAPTVPEMVSIRTGPGLRTLDPARDPRTAC